MGLNNFLQRFNFFLFLFLRIQLNMYSSNYLITIFPQIDNTYTTTHKQMKQNRRVQHA